MDTRVQLSNQKSEDLSLYKKAQSAFLFMISFFLMGKKESASEVKVKKNNRLSNDEFIKLAEEARKKYNWSFSNAPSTYEIGFLKSIIDGEYDGYTESSFSTNRDKKLFREFNALSKTEREEKFKQFIKAMDEFVLK